jgi:hypothetical protein
MQNAIEKMVTRGWCSLTLSESHSDEPLPTDTVNSFGCWDGWLRLPTLGLSRNEQRLMQSDSETWENMFWSGVEYRPNLEDALLYICLCCHGQLVL